MKGGEERGAVEDEALSIMCAWQERWLVHLPETRDVKNGAVYATRLVVYSNSMNIGQIRRSCLYMCCCVGKFSRLGVRCTLQGDMNWL